MVISPPTHNPRVIDISIFYRTKNQVRRLCVGGDMAILFFGDFEVFREKLFRKIFRKISFKKGLAFVEHWTLARMTCFPLPSITRTSRMMRVSENLDLFKKSTEEHCLTYSRLPHKTPLCFLIHASKII